MYSRVLKSMSLAFALAFVALLPVAMSAQTAKSASKGVSGDDPSKWDIFLGYSYLAPKGSVTTSPTVGTPVMANYDAVNVGGLFSGAYHFNRYVGVQGEFGVHEWGGPSSTGSNIGTEGNDDGFLTVSGGLIARYPAGNITPFVHGLFGGAMVDGPYHQPYKWGPALTPGGGMDYETPLPESSPCDSALPGRLRIHACGLGNGHEGGRANINAARLSAGVVFHVGTLLRLRR